MRKLLVTFLMTFFCVVSNAQNNLTVLDAVKSEDAKIILNKDQIKDLKKKYSAKKIFAETWPDGKLYYVLVDNKNKRSLLDSDFNQIKFTDYAGKSFEWVAKIGQTSHNGVYYWMAAREPAYANGLYNLDGSVIIPDYAVQTINPVYYNDNLFFEGTANNNVLLSSPKKVVGVGTSIIYIPKSENDYITLESGQKLFTPAHKDYFYIIQDKHRPILVDFDYETGNKKMIPNVTLLPGNGYYVQGYGDVSYSIEKTPRDNGDGTSNIYTEIRVNYSKAMANGIALYTTDGKLVADSCGYIEISAPDNVAYTYRYYPKPHILWRKGAVSLTDSTLKVPAKFNNVYFFNDNEGNKFPYVKKFAFSNQEAFDPEASYEVSVPDNMPEYKYEQASLKRITSKRKYADVDDLLALLDIEKMMQTDSLPEKFLDMYIISTSEYYSSDFAKQTRLLEDYYNMIDPSTDSEIKYFITKDKNGVPNIGSNVIALIDKSVNNIKNWKGSSELKDSSKIEIAVSNLRDIQSKLSHNYEITIPQAYNNYVNKIEQKRIEAEKAAAEKAAFEREQRQAQLASAVFSTIFNIGNSIAKSTARPHKRTAKSSVSNSTSSRSGKADSSSNEDRRDRIAWLKREIIGLENKVRKAKESFEQAASNYANNGSWESERAMNSKKDTYEGLARQLNDYKNELESLK